MPGPELERERGLVQQQAEPAEGTRARVARGGLQRRRRRPVEQVDHERRRSARRRQRWRAPAVGAERRRVHHEIGRAAPASSSRRTITRPRRPVPSRPSTRSPARDSSRTATCHRRDPSAARARARPRGAAPPAPNTSAAPALRLEPGIAPEEPVEARGVGVVPDQALAGHDEGVDRAEASRVVGELVGELGRLGLVRHRDVGAAEPERARDRRPPPAAHPAPPASGT